LRREERERQTLKFETIPKRRRKEIRVKLRDDVGWW